MNWETIKISSTSRGKTSAYASVGFGRITLNYGACALINDYPKYASRFSDMISDLFNVIDYLKLGV